MSAKKTTIIVADDDPQLLRLMTRNLEFEGYTALSALAGARRVDEGYHQHVDSSRLERYLPLSTATIDYRCFASLSSLKALNVMFSYNRSPLHPSRPS